MEVYRDESTELLAKKKSKKEKYRENFAFLAFARNNVYRETMCM